MADNIVNYSGLLGRTFNAEQVAFRGAPAPAPNNGEYNTELFWNSEAENFANGFIPEDFIYTVTQVNGSLITFEGEFDFIRGEFETAQFQVLAHGDNGLYMRQVGNDFSDFQQFAVFEGLPTDDATVESSTPNDGIFPNRVTYAFEEDFNPAPFDLVCFAEGTAIATPAGPAAVETLAEGDLVLTLSGAARAVKWVGHMTVRPSRHPRPNEANPIRIRAGAFGEGLPLRDLRVSPGHAVYVDGVLIPAGHLVNGATIVQEEVKRIRYFHIELDSHDVLLAEGLPCESYLDDGNRMSFANAGEHVALNGRLDPQSWDKACAPMVAAGPQLIEVQQRLHARAEAMGWVKSEDAGLAIEADGVAIAPLHVSGNRFWFSVPAAGALTLRSNASILAHVLPGIGDGRTLGVAVGELRIDGVGVDLDDAAFGAGFYPAERHEESGWRWTNGAAAIARPLDAPAMVELALAMVAPSWMRPAPALKLVAQG